MTAFATCAESRVEGGHLAIGRPLVAEAIAMRLGHCAELLRDQQPLWQSVAFRESRLAWEELLPGLARALLELSLEQAERLHANPQEADDWLGRWLPIDMLRCCEEIGPWPRQALRPWPHGFARDIPGRKWQQIEGFLGAVPCCGASVVDWCAGKGHLGRAASWQWESMVVDALERDVSLVHRGEQLARRTNLPVTMSCCDVMSEQASVVLASQQHVLALHACGPLHRRLFELGAAMPVAAICCYHLESPAQSLAMSRAGANDPPPITSADRRSAVQETATAQGHARRRRRRLQQWQLGFDLLQREVRGVDEYLPLPSRSAMGAVPDFAAYCRAVAAGKEIELPDDICFSRYERAGIERFRQVTALDLVRHRFRRVLELWLVLDRAQFLVEVGYRVGVGAFCARRTSPRNLLVHASRSRWRPLR